LAHPSAPQGRTTMCSSAPPCNYAHHDPTMLIVLEKSWAPKTKRCQAVWTVRISASG
jgi:hypothetical protein